MRVTGPERSPSWKTSRVSFCRRDPYPWCHTSPTRISSEYSIRGGSSRRGKILTSLIPTYGRLRWQWCVVQSAFRGRRYRVLRKVRGRIGGLTVLSLPPPPTLHVHTLQRRPSPHPRLSRPVPSFWRHFSPLRKVVVLRRFKYPCGVLFSPLRPNLVAHFPAK